MRSSVVIAMMWCASPVFSQTITDFAPAVEFSTGSSPESLALADVNNDGKRDLIVANYFSDNVSILIANGNGTFAAPVDYPVGTSPSGVAVGDVTGEGIVDIAVAVAGANQIAVLRGNGNGTFAPAVVHGSGGVFPMAVAIGNLNDDASPDLAVVNLGVTGGTVAILLGSGDGTFGTALPYDVGASPRSVALGDLNGDGTLDIAIANGGATTASTLLGNGDGTFATKVNYNTNGQPYGVALGDVNGDGTLDLVTANNTTNTVSILLGTGAGTLATAVNYPVGTKPYGVALGDANDDEILDVAVANTDANTVSILLGTGTGTFNASVPFNVGDGPHALAVGDLNGDGQADLAVGNWHGNTMSILLNTSTDATSPFTDDPLTSATPVKAVHVTELLDAINAFRTRLALAPAALAAAITPGIRPIQAADVVLLRSALDEVFDAVGSARPPYTDPTLTAGVTLVRRVHLRQMRATVRALQFFVLTTSRNGTGSGTMISSPVGISCGTSCTKGYLPDTVVQVSAQPAADSTFTGWSGACTGTGACYVSMSADRAVTATFTKKTFTLTVTKSSTGSGTVTSSPSGITCGADCQEVYDTGTNVTLTPSAAAGSRFVNWTGACSGSGACSVTMNANATVGAVFNRQYTLTVTKSGAGAGTVTSSPSGVACGGECQEVYDQGTSVTLTATAAAGSYFSSWTGACSGTGTCTATMNADVAVGATFNIAQPWTLTVTKSGSGSGTVTSSPSGISCGADCQEVYYTGTSVTLTASAPAGSYFANWTGACSGGGQCTVTMLANATVGAVFQPFTIDIDTTRGTVIMPNKYRTGNWTVGGGYGLNWVAVPPGWSVGGGYGVNWVAVPPGWSVGGGYGVNWIAVPPGWSVGGGYGINWVAVPPGWSVGDAYGLNFVVLPPGWSESGGYGLNWYAQPPGWSDGGGYGLNWYARPPGWSDGGGYGLNWVGLAPGWTVGGGYGLNWVPQPPGWTYGGGYGVNWVGHPSGWTVGGGYGINWVAYPSPATTTIELAFDDPGWIAWFKALEDAGAMSDSDLADVMIYVLLGGGGRQGAAPSGQWP